MTPRNCGHPHVNGCLDTFGTCGLHKLNNHDHIDRLQSAAQHRANPDRLLLFLHGAGLHGRRLLGFAPTYWLPLAKQSFSASPVVHFHGLLFFAWSLYFVFQSWLAASGKIVRHRAVGMIGISLATTMTIFGFLVAVNAMKRSAAAGLTDEGSPSRSFR